MALHVLEIPTRQVSAPPDDIFSHNNRTLLSATEHLLDLRNFRNSKPNENIKKTKEKMYKYRLDIY